MSRKIFLDSVEPMFKNPITDIFNHIVDCQTYGPCADLELAMYDCVEAYGMGKRGAEKCSDLVDDYRECINKSKQRKRYLVSVVLPNILFTYKDLDNKLLKHLMTPINDIKSISF